MPIDRPEIILDNAPVFPVSEEKLFSMVGFVAVLQQKPLAVIPDPPSETTVPVTVALVELTFVTVSVLMSAEVEAITNWPFLSSPFFVVKAPDLLT